MDFREHATNFYRNNKLPLIFDSRKHDRRLGRQNRNGVAVAADLGHADHAFFRGCDFGLVGNEVC